MLKFLTSLFSKRVSQTPKIISYGEDTSNLPMEKVQPVMEWLFASLLNAKYWGKAHVIWFDDAHPLSVHKEIGAALRRNEPLFLYRIGDRPSTPLTGYYWRLMPEHSSLRIYQLEAKDEDDD